MEQRQSFWQMVLEQLNTHMQKINLDPDLTPSTKTSSNWPKDLNVKCKTIKFLVDNIGENLDDFGYHDAFLDTTPKEWSMKVIIDKLDFIKIKNFCSVKAISRELEDKPQTGRKYLQKTHLIKDCYPKYTMNS